MPKDHAPRNKGVNGVMELSRSAIYRKSGRWAIKNKVAQKKDAKKDEMIVKKFGKDGKEERSIPKRKAATYYPTEDVHRKLKTRKAAPKPTKLRDTITAGTVLILLAGRFRGKRVIFLKQLESGLLLVTGPHKINGVPLRRVNQAYVIATSCKVDVTGVDATKISDAYFAHEEDEKEKKELFADEKEKKEVSPKRVADQKAIDTPILAAIKSHSDAAILKAYLNSHFTLTDGQFPHEMVF